MAKSKHKAGFVVKGTSAGMHHMHKRRGGKKAKKTAKRSRRKY